MTLHEKAIPFTLVEEDLKNLSPQLRALHPEAKVPVLVHNTRVLYESSIITEYLEDLYPTKNSLMPQDPGLRAEVRLWTYWCNQIFKPDVDRLKYGKSRFPEAECLEVPERVTEHAKKLDKNLSQSSFLVGGAFSLADIHVFPFCRQLIRISPTPTFLSLTPALLSWADRISNRPSFIQTMGRDS